MINVARTSLALCVIAAGAVFAAPPKHVPYPVEQWAMREVMQNVQLSPDGKHVALLRIPSRDGNPILEVYDAANLAEKPFRMNAHPMELIGFGWLNDSKIYFIARDRVRDHVQREQDPYKYRFSVLDVASKKLQKAGPLASGEVGIAQLLPHSPDKVIISIVAPSSGKVSDFARRVSGFLSPNDYYEYDLTKGTRKLLVQGRMALGNYTFDPTGRLLFAGGYDSGEREARFLWRPPGESDWVEFHRQGIDDIEFKQFNLQALDDTMPHHAYVIARNGHDTYGLWSYDLKNKRFAELIYKRPDVDVTAVVNHSNTWQHPGKVVGVLYNTDKWRREFFDEAEAALYMQLESIIPSAHNISIASRSRDGATLVVSNQGPHDPGTYYLIKDGKLVDIGSQQPLFASENLADMEFVKYSARDGRKLFAYVTKPKGEPPFPLIVLPHGGPQARDFGGYDKWAQLLANYGYLVIQPQYRGSTGFGASLRQAAFEEGGQEGGKMQDDKDDAALYLVKRGLADKDRMAMFGWSYGGYAAAVAASRTPQLYQCTVAGAGVFDPVLQFRYDRRGASGEILDRYIAYEAKSIKPVDEVAKVNVPMLIVHGVVDRRVLIDHATKYVKLLEEHDKPYKYVRLEGADHFYSTLLYDHQIEFFSAMIDFLANDCGPGGL